MRSRLAWSMLAAGLLAAEAAAQDLDPRQLERIERVVRQEGEAILALADLPADESSAPSDFVLTWHNDYFKAQAGTFVPFVVSITPAGRKAAAALLYVRLARRGNGNGDDRPRNRALGDGASFPVEEIYPVELAAERGRATRVARGFAVAPGDYDVTVVVRERERRDERRRRLAGVLRRSLTVPDYSGSDLATSSIMLADAITALSTSLGPGELEERPYVVGSQEIHPAPDRLFRRHEELIVVFLVYNPFVTPDKQFDLEVEYHFFRKSGAPAGADPRTGPAVPAALPGESYVNRTEPQRFNPSVLGPQFDPASGQPVMAGQGVPLSGFQEGDYRLAIRVVDLVSGRSLERHVTFTVGS